jgi:hypothetical protein
MIFCISRTNPDGNRNVVYLNWNDSKRNLNLNWLGYDWPAIYRFLAVGKCFYSPCIFREFIFVPDVANHPAYGQSQLNILIGKYIFCCPRL